MEAPTASIFKFEAFPVANHISWLKTGFSGIKANNFIVMGAKRPAAVPFVVESELFPLASAHSFQIERAIGLSSEEVIVGKLYVILLAVLERKWLSNGCFNMNRRGMTSICYSTSGAASIKLNKSFLGRRIHVEGTVRCVTELEALRLTDLISCLEAVSAVIKACEFTMMGAEGPTAVSFAVETELLPLARAGSL